MEEDQGEEIVVRATYGRTTMLFDKGSDGRLRNCRIMVSSGSQRRDSAACKATPVCFEKTRDEVSDCVELTALERAAIAVPPAGLETAKTEGGIQTFTMPTLVKPMAPIPTTAVGPIQKTGEDRESERQRVQPLPPAPRPKTDGPAITFGGVKPEPDPMRKDYR